MTYWKYVNEYRRGDFVKKRIRDIAEIRSGYQFRGKVTPDDNANVAVIQIKDIDDQFRVQTHNLLRVKVDKPQPFLVTQGDVLFVSRGPRLNAAVAPQPLAHTIATGYFYIVSPDRKLVRPEFLAWSINQPDFQESLRPFTRGSNVALISKTDFQDLTIELPPLRVQDTILELQQLTDRERDLTAALHRKRDELVRAVSRRLLTGRFNTRGNRHG